MAGDPQTESKNWWQTLPGVLTAVAALITAITGLVIAIHQSGWFDHAKNQETSSTSRSADHSTGANKNAGLRQIAIPENAVVRTDTAVYKLIAGHAEPAGPDRILLRVAVRMTNESGSAANFWSNSFRLIAGKDLLTPANLLDEVVDARSSKEGDLEFQLPANTREVGFQMGDVGFGKPAIQLRLP